MLMSRGPKGPNIQHVAGRREVQGFVIKGIERERATDRPTERASDAPTAGARTQEHDQRTWVLLRPQS